VQSLSGGYEIRVQKESTDIISIASYINGVSVDDIIYDFYLEIRVYY